MVCVPTRGVLCGLMFVSAPLVWCCILECYLCWGDRCMVVGDGSVCWVCAFTPPTPQIAFILLVWYIPFTYLLCIGVVVVGFLVVPAGVFGSLGCWVGFGVVWVHKRVLWYGLVLCSAPPFGVVMCSLLLLCVVCCVCVCVGVVGAWWLVMVVFVGVWGHHGYSKVFVLGQPFAHCSVHWCWCCWFLCNACMCLWELLVLDLV